jgi:hypothetical protein
MPMCPINGWWQEESTREFLKKSRDNVKESGNKGDAWDEGTSDEPETTK